MKKTTFSLAAAALATAACLTAAHAAPVGLELVLLVDVSGSVDSTEYNLQKTGYVNAFNSASLQSAILSSQGGAIAVTYVEWSGNNQQSQRVGWTLINSVASAQAFAAAINASTRAFAGNTALQDALLFAAPLFGTETGAAGNGFESTRQVIDVSGDGADNNTFDCNTFANPACGRDAALAAGVDTVNGLPILGESGLLGYYQTNVQGGASAFTIPAGNFESFNNAVSNKLVAEISRGTPEPGSLALAGLALAGLAGLGRKKRD